MYLKIDYEPTSLFSLKKSEATNSAGKSLFSPSPYSIKMALLNAIITYDSLDSAKENFNLIRDLEISYRLPNNIVVNNCFIKIMKDNDKAAPEEKLLNPFKTTVAFREYVYLGGIISFAVESNTNTEQQQNYEFLQKWFMHINYFGKKGCFFQFVNSEIITDLDKSHYSSILIDSLRSGLVYQMDDMSDKNDFEDISSYSKKKPKRDKKLFVLPYKLVESNKNYSYYKVYETLAD